MSTQSGISASQELLGDFKSLRSGAIVVKISNDSTQLVPDHDFSLPSTTDSKAILEKLHEYFANQFPTPGYAVFPREDDGYVFISFIPDSAPIKQKMLFASTKNTLIQQLGSSNFGPKHILALTEVEELTKESYDKQTLNDNDGPLTTNEQMLAQIDSLQNLNLAQSASNNAFKRELPSMHTSSESSSSESSHGLLFKIDPSLHEVLEQELTSKLIIIRIDGEAEKLGLLSEDSGVKPSEIIGKTEKALLGATASPTYVLYGHQPGEVAFIYLCPSGSKVKERMLYAANKQGLLRHLKAEYPNLKNILQELEVGDLDELDVSKLEKKEPKSHDQHTHGNLRFSKPKGPRRR